MLKMLLKVSSAQLCALLMVENRTKTRAQGLVHNQGQPEKMRLDIGFWSVISYQDTRIASIKTKELTFAQ